MKGIGCDIIEISRIESALDEFGEKFKEKILTSHEIHTCRSTQQIAGRFAAKEAIVKALGTGFGKEVGFQDIEIQNDEKGKPFALLKNGVNENLGSPKILLSISHSKTNAMAVALIEER